MSGVSKAAEVTLRIAYVGGQHPRLKLSGLRLVIYSTSAVLE